MFGSITRHIKERVLRRGINDLATTGKTGLEGIGTLHYDYINNVITVEADPKVLEQVRKLWDQEHHGIAYEI